MVQQPRFHAVASAALIVFSTQFCGHVARAAPAQSQGAAAGYADLSDAERRALQEALIWTGDFTGVASGLFGPKTREAIASYEKRLGLPLVDLDAAQRARLLATAERSRKAVGFGPVADGRAGVQLALPLKLLPKQVGTGSGTRYSAPDGTLVVDTLTRPAGEGGLADAFARMSAAGPSRTVGYKLLRPDFFVVTGEAGDRKFYSRFEAATVGGQALIRGFTLSYPKSSAAALDPIALAVAASFVPFPTGVAALAESAAAPKLGSETPAAANAPPPGFVTEAVLVGPGTALTRVDRNECPSASVGSVTAAWRAGDPGSRLAVLDVPGASGPSLDVAARPIAPDDVLFALFFADAGDGSPRGDLLAAAARVEDSGRNGVPNLTVVAPVQGSAILVDRAGALAGFTLPGEKPPAAVAGVVPQTRYRVAGVDRIHALLQKPGARAELPEQSSPPSMTLGEVAARLKPSILSVTCTGKDPARP